MRTLTFGVIALAAVLVGPALALPTGAASGPTQSDGILTSFDGTKIVYTLFLPAGASAATPVPAVLMTHGWAGSRTTTPTGIVGALLAQGYAVLTWDSRGFGVSGGFVELDSPSYEVKDASALIDLLAANPVIQQDAAGDPRVGMTGGSYAGGIQLLTAAFDHRVDAITPDITWNDLRQSLGPNGVPKTAWIEVLFGSGAATGTALGASPTNPAGPDARSYDINLPLWWSEVHATNGITADVDHGLFERSTAAYINHIAAPTLFTQGLPDTLFNPNEAMANYHALVANGVPAKIVLGCFGHAGCPYASDDAAVQTKVLGWLGHYLKNDGSGTGANAEWYTNDGVWHAAASWPPADASWLGGSAHVTLASTPAPTGGGGFAIGAGGVSGATPKNPVSDNGVGSALIPIPGAAGKQIAGIGHVHVAATGEGTEAFLFFRLVDATTGDVLDGQTQAFRMPISPLSTSEANVDLVGVGYQLPAGHGLALQVSTSDLSHANNRQPGAYTLDVTASVPVVG